MKKALKNNIEKPIEVVVEEFKQMCLDNKDKEGQMKKMKAQLLEYAQARPAQFKGNTFTFSNGVQVTWSERKRNAFNQDLIDLDWLAQFLDTASADAVSIGIDHRLLHPADEATRSLLDRIDYNEEVVKVWTVQVTQKSIEK